MEISSLFSNLKKYKNEKKKKTEKNSGHEVLSPSHLVLNIPKHDDTHFIAQQGNYLVGNSGRVAKESKQRPS